MSDFKFAEVPVDAVYDTVGLDGYIRLWRSVIDQSIDDVLRNQKLIAYHKSNPSMKGKYERELEKCLQYLRAIPTPEESYDDDTPGIIKVCAMARIPYEMVRRKCSDILKEEGIEL